MTEPLLGQSDGIDPRDECNCPPNPSGDHADACLAAREFKAMKYRTIVADPPWHYDGFAGSIGYGGHFAGQEGNGR